MLRKTAALRNLGCRVNEYETEKMARALEERGYLIVPFDGPADVYIVNTCTVTNIADRKSRQMLHRAKKLNPDALVVAAGCYADIRGEELVKDPLVDIAVGNTDKLRIADILEDLRQREDGCGAANVGSVSAEERAETEKAGIYRTRAFLKIQDGCNQFCTYCIIPYARGRIRSEEPEKVIREAGERAARGQKEIVLTGIHLSSYGRDRGEEPGTALADLVGKIAKLPGIERIRFGSLEPRLMSESFVRVLQEIPAVCPQFHLSLQSGCDTVLRRMNRHYTAAEYAEITDRIRTIMPDAAVTTDVIAGFPGETDEEFEETLCFLREIRLARLHVFRYSKRGGTPAAKMPGQVPESVKAERAARILALGAEGEQAFAQRFIGKNQEVLAEEIRKVNGQTILTGYTREYVPVHILCEGGDSPRCHAEALCGTMVSVCPDRAENGTLLAELSSFSD